MNRTYNFLSHPFTFRDVGSFSNGTNGMKLLLLLLLLILLLLLLLLLLLSDFNLLLLMLAVPAKSPNNEYQVVGS